METELNKFEIENIMELRTKAIEQIVILAFEKAKEESLRITKTALAKHIAEVIENEYREYISVRTFVRYYDEYIEKKEGERKNRDRKIIDLLCRYIGYKSFLDFCNEIEIRNFVSENKKNKHIPVNKNNIKKEFKEWFEFFMLLIIIIILMWKLYNVKTILNDEIPDLQKLNKHSILVSSYFM